MLLLLLLLLCSLCCRCCFYLSVWRLWLEFFCCFSRFFLDCLSPMRFLALFLLLRLLCFHLLFARFDVCSRSSCCSCCIVLFYTFYVWWVMSDCQDTHFSQSWADFHFTCWWVSRTLIEESVPDQLSHLFWTPVFAGLWQIWGEHSCS